MTAQPQRPSRRPTGPALRHPARHRVSAAHTPRPVNHPAITSAAISRPANQHTTGTHSPHHCEHPSANHPARHRVSAAHTPRPVNHPAITSATISRPANQHTTGTHSPRHLVRPPGTAAAAGNSSGPYPNRDRQRVMRRSHPTLRTAALRLNRQTLRYPHLEQSSAVDHPEAS